VPDKFQQTAAGGIERFHRRSIIAAVEQSLSSVEIEVAFRLFTAMTLKAGLDQ